MKNARLLLCAATALCAMSAMPRAGVRWLETKHNFGAFAEETGPVTCEFLMVNDGPGDASIVAARATCGCTQPTYTVNSLAPGDTARLSVTFDPMGRPGRFNKQIYVETSGTPAKQRLDITGVVIGAGETVARRFPVDMGPLKLATGGIMIGEVTKGHLKTVYTEGYNRSSDSLRVAVVRRPSWIEVIPSPEVAAPGEQVTLISYLNSTACPQYGLIEDSVTISPVPGLEFTLPLTVMVNEDFSQLGPEGMEKAPIAIINDQFLDYGTINRSDGSQNRSFTIGNSGHNKLLIRRIYTTDPGVDIRYKNDSVGRGKKATVTVTVDPQAITGNVLNAKLVIITNDPLQPMRTLRLVGDLK